MEEIIELLRTKVEAERNAFRRKMSNAEPLMVYDGWYKICFFESYYELLMSDEITKHANVVRWLASFTLPLEQLYASWLSCSAHFSGLWDDMIDWLEETCELSEEDESWEDE